jgi:hypothetical protein
VTLTIPPGIEVLVVEGPRPRRSRLYPTKNKFRWIKFLNALFGGLMVVLTLSLSHFHPSMAIRKKIAGAKDVSSYFFMVSYLISRNLKSKMLEKEDRKLSMVIMACWCLAFTTALGFLMAVLYFIIFH